MSRNRLLAVLLTLAGAPAIVLTAQQTVSPPAPAVEPPQVIVLLVDLRTRQGDERQSAVLSAQTALTNMWRKWTVGLTRPYLFAVKTIGARIETIMDFTWSPDLVYAALLKVAAQPSTSAAVSSNQTESLSAMCEELAQSTASVSQFAGLQSPWPPDLAPASVPRAVYYYNRTSLTVDAIQHVRELARACARPNVLFLISLSLESRPVAPPPVGVSVRIVPHQAGSPVSIVESMSPLDDGYASVVLRDDADKAIRSVTLAVLVRPTDPAMTTPQVFIRRGPSVVLLPRATTAIAVQLIDQSTLDAFARKGADIELGVVAVEFADGSTWSYDLAAKGRFERH